MASSKEKRDYKVVALRTHTNQDQVKAPSLEMAVQSSCAKIIADARRQKQKMAYYDGFLTEHMNSTAAAYNGHGTVQPLEVRAERSQHHRGSKQWSRRGHHHANGKMEEGGESEGDETWAAHEPGLHRGKTLCPGNVEICFHLLKVF
jgi:hypothetical protein